MFCDETISILIPACNVEAYITPALQSIQTQTFKNWEAVVVVNNTNDSTIQIAKDFASSDPRFKVFDIGRCDTGIVGALNFGLSKCTGAYIARFDADDLMLEGRLSTQLEVMNDGDLDIVGVNVTYMIGDRFSIPKISLPLKASTSANIFPYRNPIMHSWLTRRGVYDLLSGYRMISYAEDYDFIGRALLKGLKVGSIPSRLQIQREREGNTATTNYKKQVASQILVSRAFCRRTLLDRRFEDEFPEQLKMLLDRFDFMSFLFERGPFPRPLRSRFHFHAYLHAAICRMKL